MHGMYVKKKIHYIHSKLEYVIKYQGRTGSGAEISVSLSLATGNSPSRLSLSLCVLWSKLISSVGRID
jgi:hypothetical protein